MNPFQSAFKKDDVGFNRLGEYTVEGFTDDGMWVRYDDGSRQLLTNFDLQMRIVENMLLDQAVLLEERDWERGYTSDEEDFDMLVREAETELVPRLDDLVETASAYKVLRQASQEECGDYTVYTILLSKLSRQMRWGFHAVGSEDQPCIYVGQSWYEPKTRFEQHKTGEHSSYFVRRFGLALLPELHAPFHSLSREMAEAAEASLADALGDLGCTVFGGH